MAKRSKGAPGIYELEPGLFKVVVSLGRDKHRPLPPAGFPLRLGWSAGRPGQKPAYRPTRHHQPRDFTDAARAP